MSDFLALLDDDEEEVVEASVVQVLDSPLSPKESEEAGLKRIEERVLHESSSIVQNALRFHEIDPEDDSGEPPAQWVREMGYENALKAYRVARYSLMSQKEAPIGLHLAQRMMAGIMANKSREKAGPQNLMMNLISMPQPRATYEEMDDE